MPYFKISFGGVWWGFSGSLGWREFRKGQKVTKFVLVFVFQFFPIHFQGWFWSKNSKKFTVKKIIRLKFDLNQKSISYKLMEMMMLRLCMSYFFDFIKIQPSDFFYGQKKSGFTAKIRHSQILSQKILVGRNGEQCSNSIADFPRGI